jgi:hypothetical protein
MLTTREYYFKYIEELKKIHPDLDVSPQSLDAQVAEFTARIYGELTQRIVGARQAVDVNSATGTHLDDLAVTRTLSRKRATKSTVELHPVGTSGTVIPDGSIVSDGTNQWEVLQDAIIPSPFTAQCQKAGAIEASTNTVIEIVTPITGWESVSNPLPAIVGREEETDRELRARIKRSGSINASGTLTAYEAAIAQVEGVTHYRLNENIFNTSINVGAMLQDPHSVLVLVRGGDLKEIAQALVDKKGIGHSWSANTGFSNDHTETVYTKEEEIETSDGKKITVGGSENAVTIFGVVDVPLTVIVTLKNVSNAPSDLDDQIKESIYQYSNATLFSGESLLGFDRTGFEIGEDINSLELVTPVSKVLGSYGKISSVTINGTSDVSIQYNQLAVIDKKLIEVNRI